MLHENILIRPDVTSNGVSRLSTLLNIIEHCTIIRLQSWSDMCEK